MEYDRLESMTFMSWENTGSSWNNETKKYEIETLRAIALCDGDYFMQAINCLRDGDMGEKDENGVYSRIWYRDYLYKEGKDGETLRPATKEEVDLYLQYCPVGSQMFDEACFIELPETREYLGVLQDSDGSYVAVLGVKARKQPVIDNLPPKEQKKVHFNNYINELCKHYAEHNSLRGMSNIRTKYPVQSITKEQFFECGINFAARNNTQLDREFTDAVYEYIKSKDKSAEAPFYTLNKINKITQP